MYCRNCGNKLNDGARFCTKCGTKVEWQGTEPEQQNTEPEIVAKESVNKRYTNLRKIITVVFAGVFVLMVVKNIMSQKEQMDLSSGRSTDIVSEAETDVNAKTGNDTQTETDVKKVTDEAAETETKNNTKNQSEEFQEYIEKTYGIAEDYIQAESITQSETISGTVTNSTSEKFKEGSHGGSVLYKTVTSPNGTEGGVSVYLHEDENNDISLSATYMPDTENGSYTVDLASPKYYNNTCSVIVGEDCFASIEQEEGPEDATGQWIYKEKITVRQLAPGNVTELYTVSRKFTMDVQNLKECIIKKGSEVEMYVEGYGSYTADGATFLSTENEFNNKANDLFKEKFSDCVRLNKLSEYSTYNKSMNVINANASLYGIVKVNFLSDDPYVDENGDTVTDIEIYVNK